MTSPKQWNAVFFWLIGSESTSAVRHLRGKSEFGGRVLPWVLILTNIKWMRDGESGTVAPSSGERRAGLAQWQSSLDSWLSSALLSSFRGDAGSVLV